MIFRIPYHCSEFWHQKQGRLMKLKLAGRLSLAIVLASSSLCAIAWQGHCTMSPKKNCTKTSTNNKVTYSCKKGTVLTCTTNCPVYCNTKACREIYNYTSPNGMKGSVAQCFNNSTKYACGPTTKHYLWVISGDTTNTQTFYNCTSATPPSKSL